MIRSIDAAVTLAIVAAFAWAAWTLLDAWTGAGWPL